MGPEDQIRSDEIRDRMEIRLRAGRDQMGSDDVGFGSDQIRDHIRRETSSFTAQRPKADQQRPAAVRQQRPAAAAGSGVGVD